LINNLQNLFSLTDQVVIITGGAGHLGSEISKGLASFGARVIVLGRSEERFQPLLDFNSSGAPGEIECVVCDVSDEHAFAKVVDQTWFKYGRIDTLINNASSGNRDKWEELDKDGWLQGLEGALNHYFTCTKAVSKYMLEAGKGSIVNNASLWSFLAPNPNIYLDLGNEPPVHIAAAKGAILQTTRYLATLWAPKGVRVNSFSPGWFPKKSGPERPDYLHEITSRTPMERIGVPEDIVGVVVFLVSNASSFMTGQNLVVDGGYSVW
jgi:NAD(P)-dependent dehydrogenase (short-subunit alcohol dehydrogenase family)